MALGRDDITAGFNYGANLINQAARSVINKSNSFIEQVLGMKIDERVDFNDMNYEYMKRLMKLNIYEKEITLNTLGNDAHFDGDPTSFNGQAQRPSYTQGMNYIEDFAASINGSERIGLNTTRSSQPASSSSPYPEVENLYPDDLDNGIFRNKWRLDNVNSILDKTKKLFVDKKINTIISRFGTSADNGGSSVVGIGDNRTEYGMSHGRNLLKKGAETSGEKYDVNGYNNPYCRVWTHHYQYDRLNKLIRPFVGEMGSEGESLKTFHKWKGFEKPGESIGVVNEKTGKEEYVTIMPSGWKNGDNGWDKSVLDDNGFVKITPKYLGGGKKNIHTKDCMFSIENLAWRGYDPYSFEKALSWEQRGPFGGRIMWFPPYGLSFNETTQANWSSNTFIGRGEDVYTYVNTVRSGTLSFIMLTDHPSIIDYANWYDKKDENKLTDTDILRFFAGCDKSAVLDAAKPTPLTDEYTQNIIVNEEIKKIPPNPQPEPAPEIPDSEEVIQFYVFYPNNYSGCYDKPTNMESPVHSIAYLLFGNGCNKEYNSTNFGNDIPLDFDLGKNSLKDNTGNGYEMNGNGISVNDEFENYIVGSAARWVRYKSKIYKPDVNKKWYYRIDGKYEVATKNVERTKNTYDQVLLTKSNYYDTSNFNLNLNADAVKECGLVNENEENLYSLAEIAAAIAKGNDGSETPKLGDTYRKLETLGVKKDVISKLTKLFYSGDMVLSSVEISGYSNSHGYNNSKEVNKKRNDSLSIERANSVKNWLLEYKLATEDKFVRDKDESSVQVEASDRKNVNGKSAKKYRSTKVVMRFATNKTQKLSEASSGETEEGKTTYQKYNGFTPCGTDSQGRTLYANVDNTDEKWYETEDGELRKLNTTTMITSRGDNTGNEYIISPDYKNYKGRLALFHASITKNEKNKIRYDQEYHFFKQYEESNPIVFKKLTDKLKFFDPAFHSMTPEGFTERLTFLNQCTRQGNTISTSDHNGKTANNLAFGRPPFCVLRIGDFYYQTIIIDSINIDYNVSGGLQWDLNPEGNGVQPMLAQINISFKFVGGGDLGGPIRRLQNAMTFNYYANSRLSDNRADRISYNWDDKTGGALNHDVDSVNSFAYTTQMAK